MTKINYTILQRANINKITTNKIHYVIQINKQYLQVIVSNKRFLANTIAMYRLLVASYPALNCPTFQITNLLANGSTLTS